MKKDYLIVDIETTGLNPMENEITCIGCLNAKDKNSRLFVSDDKKGEEGILKKFWEFLKAFKPDSLVGWNIDNFDWKFLKIRSLLNGVKISKYYKKKERIDLMVLLKTPKWQSLNSYTRLLFKDEKMHENPIDLFRQERFEELAKFNAKDLELTLKVFEKCVECGIIVEDDEMVECDKPTDLEAEAKKEAKEKQKV